MSENSVVVEENNIMDCREPSLSNVKRFEQSNEICVKGIIEENFKYSHGAFGREFFKTRVKVARLSGVDDYIPILVSVLLLPNILTESFKGKYIEVEGQLRSYHIWGEDNRRHLKLFLFAKKIEIDEGEDTITDGENLVYLEGRIGNVPLYKKTHLGRKITELFIITHRSFGASDYIPCIAWGSVAVRASKLVVGDKIRLQGRFQSREYFKRLSPDSPEGEKRIAYEVSIMEMEVI